MGRIDGARHLNESTVRLLEEGKHSSENSDETEVNSVLDGTRWEAGITGSRPRMEGR